uniref:Ribosomal RNA-processing protein 14/surfeit locus protein 6 C-terminal domain-containing protein n=1 Tax=Periophthalmus magnuspinnatus TaxID=409849 RepID=A0A3B3ZM17_9GOBI
AKDNTLTKKKKKLRKKPTPKPQQNKTTTSPVTQKIDKTSNVEITFSGVDLLRKRLHEKIEAARGQGPPKDASSPEVQAKRAKRKLERERKKRKRKEIQMKKLSEKSEVETKPEIKQEGEIAIPVSKRNETAIVFNKVETVEEGFEDKMVKKQNKKKSLKGQITPLTGKNYKQLLSRVEARKAKLEELREKDADKALEMENKIKWTNMLYKAEGIKIKDDEKMLRIALKRKEKRKTQRKKKWDQRSENVIEKMQHRQDKRKKNILKRKKAKVEKKKDKARKRGRVLPEDLKKAGI